MKYMINDRKIVIELLSCVALMGTQLMEYGPIDHTLDYTII